MDTPVGANDQICNDSGQCVSDGRDWKTLKKDLLVSEAVLKAKENIKNAHLDEFVHIQHEDFFKTKKSGSDKLHMVFNPPYGERLENLNVEEFYGDIGTTLKHGYPNTNAWLITSNLEALKFVGLRPSRKIKVFNAKLEARLVKYEMYEGSKKTKKQNL